MNILFLHPNFPGQYVFLAGQFASFPNWNVVFLTKEDHGGKMEGVQTVLYKLSREVTKGIHHYVSPMEEAVLEGQAVCRKLSELKQQGFVPDVIIGHTGWGSSLFIKDLYPNVPLLGYFEWYYHSEGSDVAYWPDEVVSMDDRFRIRSRNAHHLLNLEACDGRYCPTEWQRSQFPAEYRDQMTVLHEGIDTRLCSPKPGAKLVLPRIGLDLSEAKEIVTYVSRGMEQYRGFPQFMESVRLLLKYRPHCHVVIAGNDRAYYGPSPANNRTFKDLEIEKGGYDTKRVHFTGHLEKLEYVNVLQASDVHVYLTRPFVLSWSMLESMSAGVCLVGSATPPVQEVVQDGVNGLLANFRSPEHIVMRIEEALNNPALRQRLGRNARETILTKYELGNMLRQQVNYVYSFLK